MLQLNTECKGGRMCLPVGYCSALANTVSRIFIAHPHQGCKIATAEILNSANTGEDYIIVRVKTVD